MNQKMGLSGQDVDLLHSAVLNRSSEEMGRTWQDYKCLENHRKFTSLKMEPLHPSASQDTQNSEAEYGRIPSKNSTLHHEKLRSQSGVGR